MAYPQQAGYAPPPYQATVMVPQPVRATYAVNNNDPRWRTCCCHVYTCTIIIATLEGFGLLGQLSSTIPVGQRTSISIASSVFALVIGGIVIALLACGLWQKRALFLIPHLVCQAISVVIFIVMAILVVVAIVTLGVAASVNRVKTEEYKSETGYSYGSNEEIHGIVTGIAVVLVLIWLLAAALEIWWFVVVLRCYRWLREGAFMGPGAGTYATYTTGYPQQGAPLLHQGPSVGAFATYTVTTTTTGYPQQGAPLLHQAPDTKQYP